MRKEISSKIFHTLMTSCLVALSLALVVPIALAQTWQQVPLRTKAQATAGLAGGEGFQMVFSISWVGPNTVYFSTDTSQVWKSTDAGTTWNMRGNGLKALGVESIVASPYDENLVLAASSQMSTYTNWPDSDHGIYRTMNGGDTWSKVYTTDFYRTGYGGTLFAFMNANVVYAGTHRGLGILKSIDSGATWTVLTPLGGARVLDLRRHPTDSSVLYVSTSGGLKKLTDNGGLTITSIGDGLPRNPDVIQIDKINPLNIYASVRTYGVYKSTDGGKTFSPMNMGLPVAKNAAFLTMSPADPNYLLLHSKHYVDMFYTHNAGSANPSWSHPISADEKNGVLSASVRNVGKCGPIMGQASLFQNSAW